MERHYPVRRYCESLKEAGVDSPEPALLMATLLRVTQRVQERIRSSLRQHELTLTEFLLLETLLVRGKSRPLLPGKLAKRMLVHKSTIAMRIDDLQDRGLVVRKPHPTDGRSALVSLTDEGVIVTQEATRALAEVHFGVPNLAPATALRIVADLLVQDSPTRESPPPGGEMKPPLPA